MNAPDPELTREDIRDRVRATIDQLRDEGADRPPDTTPPPPPRRRSHLLMAALGAVIALELAAIGILGRVEPAPAVAVAPDRCDAALAKIERGLEAYRAKELRLPGSLAALVPEYLGEIPPASDSGQTIEYRASGEGYALHCPGRS